MKRRGLLVITLLVTLVATGIYATEHRSAAASETAKATKLGTGQNFEAAQAQVAFHIRTASWLPFVVPVPFAMVKHLPRNVTAVDVEYVAAPRNYVRVTTMDHPVTQISRYTLTTVTLGNGQSAKFLDNGVAQILTWNEGGMSYQIVAAKPSGSYTAADLARIADALK